MAYQMLSGFTYRIWLGLLMSPYWNRLWVIQEIVLAWHDFILVDGQQWALGDLHDALVILLNNVEPPAKQVWSRHAMDRMFLIQKKIAGFAYKRLMIKLQQSCIRADEKAPNYLNWDFAIALSFEFECSLQFDRIYGLMGLLVHKELKIDPDYTITQKELLRRVLQSQLSFVARHMEDGDGPSVWGIVSNLIFDWSQTLNFEPIVSEGLVQLPSGDRYCHYEKLKPEDCRIIQHNVRLLLRKLEMSIPAQIIAQYGADCPCGCNDIASISEPGATGLNSENSVTTSISSTEVGAQRMEQDRPKTP